MFPCTKKILPSNNLNDLNFQVCGAAAAAAAAVEGGWLACHRMASETEAGVLHPSVECEPCKHLSC